MRAIVIHSAKDLRVEEAEAREPQEGEVLVRIVTGGICGSDLHYYNRSRCSVSFKAVQSMSVLPQGSTKPL